MEQVPAHGEDLLGVAISTAAHLPHSRAGKVDVVHGRRWAGATTGLGIVELQQTLQIHYVVLSA